MLALVAGAFVLKSSLSARLAGLDKRLDTLSAPAPLDSVLLALNTAENDFQQACLDNDPEALAAYKQEMSHSLDWLAKTMNHDTSALRFPSIRRCSYRRLFLPCGSASIR